MPAFRIYLDDPDASTHVVQATDPEAARDEARRRFALPIRKIKLDRATVEPSTRAPRLTRRELKETARMPTIGEQLVERAKTLLAANGKPIAARVAESGPRAITSADALVRKMADDMRSILAAKGNVEEADLLGLHYTREAIAKYSLAACDLANTEVERIVS